MGKHHKNQKVYTLDYLKELSKQANSRKEFRKKFPGAYIAVYVQGFQEKVFKKYKKERKDPGKYSAEECVKLIENLLLNKKIRVQKDLKKINSSLFLAYCRFQKRGDVPHFFNTKKLYSKTECHNEAKKYKSRTEFKLKSSKKYTFAYRRNWLNEICAHMKGKRDNFRENFCRSIFERELNAKFPTERPKWLRNPRTGYRLELDGYCKELNIAFEYNGRVHYDTKHPNYEKTVYRDAIKKEICEKRGIILIIISAIPPEEIEKKVIEAISELKRLNLIHFP